MKKGDNTFVGITQDTSINNSEKNNMEDEDILIESVSNENSSIIRNRNHNSKRKEKGKIENITELKNLIYSYDPPEIKDWPKRPYKTIAIVFLLLFSGILFSYVGFSKYTSGDTYDVYLPYSVLGFLLLIPGIYYSFILVNVLIGSEGYEYSDIPDLNE